MKYLTKTLKKNINNQIKTIKKQKNPKYITKKAAIM